MKTRIVWTAEERSAVQEKLKHMFANNAPLSLGQIKKALTDGAQCDLNLDRRRSTFTPKELETVYVTVNTERKQHNKTERFVVDQVGVLTVAEMIVKLNEWAPFIQAIDAHSKKHKGASVFADAEEFRKPRLPVPQSKPLHIEVRTYGDDGSVAETHSFEIKPHTKKQQVVVVGVHEKLRERLKTELHVLRITWIETSDSLKSVKDKTKGHHVFVNTQGVNTAVLKQCHDHAEHVDQCNGMSQLKLALCKFIDQQAMKDKTNV